MVNKNTLTSQQVQNWGQIFF